MCGAEHRTLASFNASITERIASATDNASSRTMMESAHPTADDPRRGIPCHICGAIVKMYLKPQWYAVTRGLSVGVKHTWYVHWQLIGVLRTDLGSGRKYNHALSMRNITSVESNCTVSIPSKRPMKGSAMQQ